MNKRKLILYVGTLSIIFLGVLLLVQACAPATPIVQVNTEPVADENQYESVPTIRGKSAIFDTTYGKLERFIDLETDTVCYIHVYSGGSDLECFPLVKTE